MNTNNLEIFSDYPGGNIKIIDYKDNTVFVEQDLSGTNKWWFYWNFHAKSKNNREITFKFTNGEVVGPWGPAVSDDGLNWKWLGSNSIINRSSFKYRFEDNEEKYFSFAFPYTMKNFNIFYNIYKNSKNIKYKELTISEQNRVVPLIVTGKKKTKKDIIFTCRHHACESSASYILEGLMEYIFNNKESKLVNDYLIHIIPFVDIDGVENGEQGKNRFPHDHNRDYINRPIYRSTAAIMDYVDKLDVAFGIDFHSPHKWGADENDRSFTNWGRKNEHIFFVKQPVMKKKINQLGCILQSLTKEDQLKYMPQYDIETKGQNNFSSYLCNQDNIEFACTLEVTYAGADDMKVTQDNLRAFGSRLGDALELYISK